MARNQTVRTPGVQLHRLRRVLGACGAMFICLAACGPSTGQAPVAGATPSASAVAPQKALMIALAFEPAVLEPSLLNVSREIAPLTSAFLTYLTPRQEPMPYLAAELPSIDAGTWKTLPDGRMETTYHLRPDAKWQDGQPITAADFAFAYQVRLDPAFPVQRLNVEHRLQSVTALDDTTLLLVWKEPYGAAGMVAPPDFAPMHHELLAPMYETDKASFVEGPQWRDAFIGSGPYRVERWDPGTEIDFRANDGFVFGKPAIDRVVVKIIPDANTIAANLLGHTVDVAFSQSMGFPQGQSLEQAAWDGQVQYQPGNPRILEFQTRDWGQAQQAVTDVRVRRAALYAVDRQAMVDNIYGGKSLVAYFWLPPSDPAFPAADREVQKYAYDPARAAALLQEAGWVKGSDGVARNAAGEALEIPMQNQPSDFDEQEGLVVASDWKAAGITSDVHRLATQELTDNQLRVTFAGVSYGRRAFTLDDMIWTSTQVPTPENRWTGQNRSGYVNPDLESLWGKALGAIDPTERQASLIQALQIEMSDAVVSLTHVQPNVMATSAGLAGPAMPDGAVAAGALWNVWQWHWQ